MSMVECIYMGVEINELETPALLLDLIVEENDIQGLLIDLDNTVLHTSKYYIETEKSLSLSLFSQVAIDTIDEEFATSMSAIMRRQYFERHGQPILVIDRYMYALEEYLGVEEAQKYRDFVSEYLKEFYEVSPQIIDGALDFSKKIMKLDLPYIYTSNAQESWTHIKVREFEKELGVENIKYNAIDIDKVKNEYDWIQSSELIEVSIGNTLIVGDSLDADILAGIRAGCRNLVWINGDIEKLPLEIRENPDIHIWCVDSIKDLLKPIS